MKKLICAVCAVIMLLSCTLFGGCAGVPTPSAGTDPTSAPIKPSTTTVAMALAKRAEQPADPQGMYKSEEEMDKDYENYMKLRTQWWNFMQERLKAGKDAPDLTAFTKKLQAELIEAGKGNNLVWSPVNVYIALAMLSEITAGDTQKELLDLLGAHDIVSLRRGVAALLKAETADDGVTSCLIANSVWLNSEREYKLEALKTLAELYQTSSYSGDPFDPAFKEAITEWINDNTGGLLKEAAEDVEPGDVMTLISTLYFKAPWEDEFYEGKNTESVFHALTGDITCTFMNSTEMNGTLYITEKFTAYCRPMKSQGCMWFFLPNEGYSPDDIADAVADFLASPDKGGKSFLLHVSIPKLDVSSDLDLIPALKNAGVNKIFGGGDFSPLCDGDVYVSAIKHAARLTANELGVEAAAFTAILVCGSALFDNDEAWFTLDQPFMFALTGMSGQTLFSGSVYLPME